MLRNSDVVQKLAKLAGFAVVVGAFGLLSSCDCESCKTPVSVTKKDNETAPPVAATGDAAKADATYVVRGKVIDLPDPARATSEFVLKHEAIDAFINPATGKVVGMGSMEMPFPLAPGVSLDGVKVGDIVEITFEHFFKPATKYHVTKVTKLAADTALEFRAANVPK